VSYAGDGVQYPVFVCPECGPDKRNEWEIWWNEYRFYWQDNSKWDKHKLACIIGFFCHKYEELYGHPFCFAYTTPNPYKSKDFIMGHRLLAMFGGDAKAVRTYIKWVFAFKIRSASFVISSLGFFTSQRFVADYMHAKARAQVFRRSTPLPTEFIGWCLANEPDVFEHREFETWNDLNGLVTHVKHYRRDDTESRVAAEAVRRGMLPQGPDHIRLED
jgi:hypothetical protein